MNKTLNNQAHSGKSKQRLNCPFCSIRLIICYGFYNRGHPERGGLIKIQRYLCKAPGCPIKTFSILPYPLLRFAQQTYHTMKQVHTLRESGVNQASVWRKSGLTRGIVKRLYEFTRRLIPWLDHEQAIADWGPGFYNDPCSVWPAFIRDYSHTFYPKKYETSSPTQVIHC